MRYALVASCLFIPVVFTLLVSAVRPVFFHRFLIICLPARLLAVAVGASSSGTQTAGPVSQDVRAVSDEHGNFVHAGTRGLARCGELPDRPRNCAGLVLYYPGVGNPRRELSRLATWRSPQPPHVG